MNISLDEGGRFQRYNSLPKNLSNAKLKDISTRSHWHRPICPLT